MSNNTPILLSLLEFNLLIDKILPGFDSDYPNIPVEAGKGSDFHYSRKVVRLEDNAELSIEFTINSEIGLQDWIRDGDFDIDENKIDIYDDQGNLLAETKVEQETTEEKSNKEIHSEMVKSGQIPSYEDDSWLSVPTIELCELAKLGAEWDINGNDDTLLEKCGNKCYEIAFKYKVNAERLWTELFNDFDIPFSEDERMFNYIETRKAILEEGNDTKITINISGQDVKIKVTDLFNVSENLRLRALDLKITK